MTDQEKLVDWAMHLAGVDRGNVVPCKRPFLRELLYTVGQDLRVVYTACGGEEADYSTIQGALHRICIRIDAALDAAETIDATHAQERPTKEGGAA